MSGVVALDLFAGTGWGVACHRLGIEEFGVEIMPAAIKTREMHGMETIFHDVWDGLEDASLVPDYELLIGSPPCQTFSNAGKGKGMDALATVLAAIDDGAYKDVAKLRELAEATDPKTALVLTPLAYVWRDRPRLVVLEQVPPVLPVWHAMAAAMRQLGYSVVVEVLDAECYGVPQTRDRAILIGRLDGMADMPVPTHSRYYSSDPTRMDPGVLPWISMAEALGWGTTARPSYTLTSGGAESGGFEPFPTGARAGMAQAQAQGEWLSTNTDVNDRRGVNVTVEEALLLQSYPPGFEFCGSDSKKYLQIGNAVPVLLAQAILAAVLLPARERTVWDEVFAEVAA